MTGLVDAGAAVTVRNSETGFERTVVAGAATAEQTAFLDATMRWRVEAGEIDVVVGASSADLRLQDTLTLRTDALIDAATRGFYAE